MATKIKMDPGLTNIKKMRLALQVSQPELSVAAGVSLASVQRLDRGDVASCTVAVVCRIAWALGVSTAEMVPGLGAPPEKGSQNLIQNRWKKTQDRTLR